MSSFKIVIVLLVYFNLTTKLSFCSPTRRMPAFDAQGDDVTSIYIDFNDPSNHEILREFNVSQEELLRIRQTLAISGSTAVPNEQTFNRSSLRIRDIKNTVIQALTGNNRQEQELPTHEMAAYPICMTQSNKSIWREENNLTIKFDQKIFVKPLQSFLDKAVLRLYKINPNASSSETRTTRRTQVCDEPNLEPQISVTISTMYHSRRIKRGRNDADKKKIVNTVILSMSQTGWVEIDVKRAIHVWQNANNRMNVQIGWLSIAVLDEDGKALKPGMFFEPPPCSNMVAIPWNFYRLQPNYIANMEKVPKFPRVDFRLVGYMNRPMPVSRSPFHYSINSQEYTSIPTPTDNFLEYSSSTSSESGRHKKRHAHSHHHHTTTTTTTTTASTTETAARTTTTKSSDETVNTNNNC